jgi:diguanylate cyclase (GGDEF)-like protein
VAVPDSFVYPISGEPPGEEAACRVPTACLHATTLDSLPAHVALLDAAGRIMEVNEAWRRFGRENGLNDRTFCVGENYLEVCRKSSTNCPEADAVLSGLLKVLDGSREDFELEYACHGTERRWFRVHVSAVHSASPAGAVVTHVDITRNRLAEAEAKLATHTLRQLSKAAVAAESEYKHLLEHASKHDSLTGLANRSALEGFANEAIGRAAGQPGVCALMLIDLDRFGLLNESLGYASGDGLLQKTAARLLEAAAADELIARLGDDEFAVVSVGLADAASARERAVELCERLHFPLSCAPDASTMSASIGVSCYPADGNDFGELLRAALMALHEAKRSGGNTARSYERSMSASCVERLRLQGELAAATRAGQFVIYYQPTVDLCDGQPRSVEALLRWRHPTRGLLTPERFMGIAEESGEIIEIGEWVLQQACEDAVRLRKALGSTVTMAVNLSARQFERDDLATTVSRALQTAGLDPSNLRLELTETTVMADPDQTCSILRQIRAMGVSIALDDFGTEYSSLKYLQQFPLTCLKIDRSFVAGVPGNSRAAAITRSVVLLGKALGMNVVAEGVESAEQLEFLRSTGCDEIQGYLLARPAPYDQILEWLAGRMGHTRVRG